MATRCLQSTIRAYFAAPGNPEDPPRLSTKPLIGDASEKEKERGEKEKERKMLQTKNCRKDASANLDPDELKAVFR